MLKTASSPISELNREYMAHIQVLLVDDDPVALGINARILERHARSIRTASNGTDALGLFLAGGIDLVVTDLVMPEMGGLELAEKIRELDEDVPIIVVSEDKSEYSFLKAIDIGINHFFTKPVSAEPLLAGIAKASHEMAQTREQRSRDQLITFILDHSPNYMLISDGKQIRFLNNSFLRFLGFSGMKEFEKAGGSLDSFLFSPPDAFYANREFSDWLQDVVRHPDGDLLVRMTRPANSQVHTFLVQGEKVPSSEQYILFFTNVSHIEAERQNLREISVRDPLTKAYNRLKFNEQLEREVERGKRYGRRFALIMFDIDDFKKVNDTYGHMIGDMVLQNVVEIVNSAIRGSDLLARFGGEEFTILSVETNAAGAAALAEKLRLRIANSRIPPLPVVTCSFGVVEWSPESTIEETLQKADEALYRAKAAGKNCVMQ